MPCGDVGGGLGAVAPAVGLEGPQQEPGESPTTSISSSSSSDGSGRSGHGYAFHFLAMRQRGMLLSRSTSAAAATTVRRRSAAGCGGGEGVHDRKIHSERRIYSHLSHIALTNTRFFDIFLLKNGRTNDKETGQKRRQAPKELTQQTKLNRPLVALELLLRLSRLL